MPPGNWANSRISAASFLSPRAPSISLHAPQLSPLQRLPAERSVGPARLFWCQGVRWGRRVDRGSAAWCCQYMSRFLAHTERSETEKSCFRFFLSHSPLHHLVLE